MTVSQTEVQSEAIELSAKAFNTFCDDISDMFGAETGCTQQQVCQDQTIEALEKRFEKITAVNIVKSEGALDGTFLLLFDQNGLFTLGGVIVKTPEQKILKNRKFGTDHEAEEMKDVVREVGNLLVGAWDRIFREELEGHNRFTQIDTFIGKPWLESEETIGLTKDQEVIFVPYEMTIDSYPAFTCGVVFPKTLFTDGEQAADATEDAKPETKEEPKAEAAEEPKAETEEAPEAKAKEEPEAEAEEAPEAEAKEEPEKESEAEPVAQAEEESKAEAKEAPEAEAKEEPEKESEAEPVAQAEEEPEAEAEEAPEAEAKEEPEKESEAEPVAQAEEEPEAEAAEEPKAETEEAPEAEAKEEPEKESEAEPVAQAEEESKAEAAEEPEAETEEAPEAEAKEEPEAEAVEEPEAETEEAPEQKSEEKPVAQAEEEPEAEAAEEPITEAKEESSEDSAAVAVDDTPDGAVEKEAAVTDETKETEEQPVSKTIQQMVQSPATLPGDFGADAELLLQINAKDIMQKDFVWGSADDSVEASLTKMQQADAGYLMVGTGGVLEGIVSKSNITGAISPYLRPVFAKWRRPLDDATLQIKIKWIMSRPVHTVSPETSLAAIMDNMSQFGGRCLPVVDKDGKVQGLVTVFDIFGALLKGNSTASMAGKVPQAPPLQEDLAKA